jgi:hypothetical protein
MTTISPKLASSRLCASERIADSSKGQETSPDFLSLLLPAYCCLTNELGVIFGNEIICACHDGKAPFEKGNAPNGKGRLPIRVGNVPNA